MTTNTTHNITNPVAPSVNVGSLPSNGAENSAYMLGMSYILKILMEVGSRNTSIEDMDKKIDAKHEMEEVILNGARNQFQSAGEMAEYFSYLAEHAANLGLSNEMVGWLQNQAGGIKSVLDEKKDSTDLTLFFDVNDPNGQPMTDSPYYGEYAAYMNQLSVETQTVTNKSEIFEKEDEEKVLRHSSNDVILGEFTQSLKGIVNSSTNDVS